MLSALVKKVQDHPLWAIGWAIFVASVVFCAGEFNATEQNALALGRESKAAEVKRAELSEVVELMRQQQAFFSFYRRREEEYKLADVHALPRAARREKIDAYLEQFGEMRTRVGEMISEFRSTALDHPRLTHAKELILSDLLVADELLQARIGILERARLNRRALDEERAFTESLVHQERLKRMREDVDARGSQAGDLILRVQDEIQSDMQALRSKGEAGERRTYVWWAAMAYIAIFIILFPIWLLRSHRGKVRLAATDGVAKPMASTTSRHETKSAESLAESQAAKPPPAPAAGPLPLEPYSVLAHLTRNANPPISPPPSAPQPRDDA